MKHRTVLYAVLFALMGCAGLRAQDSTQLIQQFTTLQQQMAGASDPCPYMPKLKSLINQMAQQSPEVYAAMKPSLDLLNSEDDGCSSSSGTQTVAGNGPAQGTGTVAPPSCVYLGPGNCVPIAQYQQTQAQKGGAGICPASGYVPGVMLPNANKVIAPVPCKPGTHYGPMIATTYNGGYTGVTLPDGYTASSTGTCPAAGYVMAQTGDVAVREACVPGSPVSGSAGGNNSGASRSFPYNLLTAGDCVLERGQLTLNADGTGQWTAYIHTNHTTNRDIWHVSFSVVDPNGRQLFPVFLGDSPYMYGSPSPTIPWSVLFQFNASQFRNIANVRISTSC